MAAPPVKYRQSESIGAFQEEGRTWEQATKRHRASDPRAPTALPRGRQRRRRHRTRWRASGADFARGSAHRGRLRPFSSTCLPSVGALAASDCDANIGTPRPRESCGRLDASTPLRYSVALAATRRWTRRGCVRWPTATAWTRRVHRALPGKLVRACAALVLYPRILGCSRRGARRHRSDKVF